MYIQPILIGKTTMYWRSTVKANYIVLQSLAQWFPQQKACGIFELSFGLLQNCSSMAKTSLWYLQVLFFTAEHGFNHFWRANAIARRKKKLTFDCKRPRLWLHVFGYTKLYTWQLKSAYKDGLVSRSVSLFSIVTLNVPSDFCSLT